MSCSPFSSLASNTRSSVYFSVNDLPSYFEVSKPFQSFLGKAFAVQVEQNWWQTASFTHAYLPVKMEQCSETSAYKLQTPGNYPKESIQHLEQGESLKSRTASLSNSSSNLHTFCLPSVQSYFNTLSHVQVANQSSFTPVNTSSL
jgi:hypothetical protein